MLCSRSPSLTRTTRTSFTIASNILRTFSAWRASGAIMFSRPIFVTPSTRCATSGAKSFFQARKRIFRVLDGVMQQRRRQRSGIQLHVREDVRDFQEMRDVGVAGTAELVAVAFGGNVIRTTNQPGILRGAIGTQFFEEFFETGVELALGAVPVEIQGQVGARSHNLVYAPRDSLRKSGTGRKTVSSTGKQRPLKTKGPGVTNRGLS